MGLDINLFREEKGICQLYINEISKHNIGGDLEKVRESIKRRYQDPSIVEKILEKDAEWRKSKINF